MKRAPKSKNENVEDIETANDNDHVNSTEVAAKINDNEVNADKVEEAGDLFIYS